LLFEYKKNICKVTKLKVHVTDGTGVRQVVS